MRRTPQVCKTSAARKVSMATTHSTASSTKETGRARQPKILTLKINARALYATVTLLLLIGVWVIVAACDLSGGTSNASDAQQQGQTANANAYQRLSQAEPALQMTDSLARKEINQRYQTFNNASTFGYFYGFVQGVAQPVVEYVVKGAVFPVDDMISPPNSVVDCPQYNSGACGAVVSAPQPDGTFNTNGSAMFGFAADGTYFEWLGPYAYATHPLSFRPLVVMGCAQGAEC